MQFEIKIRKTFHDREFRLNGGRYKIFFSFPSKYSSLQVCVYPKYFSKHSSIHFIFIGEHVSLTSQPFGITLKLDQPFVDALADETTNEYHELRDQITAGVSIHSLHLW